MDALVEMVLASALAYGRSDLAVPFDALQDETGTPA